MISTLSGASRWFVGKKCAKADCQAVLTDDCAAIVVATDEQERKRLGKAKKGATLGAPLVSWVPNGRQVLHSECWDGVKHATKGTDEAKLVESALESGAEFYDSHAKIRDCARKVAAMIKSTENCKLAAFTGAGVSVAAGVSTYRGTAGIDTKKELGQGQAEEEEEGLDLDKFADLIPTKTHQMLGQLNAYVATQNCDDLHAKGGTSRGSLSDLHGNIFVESCELCDREHVREKPVVADSTDCDKKAKHYEVCPHCKWNHHTGRTCEAAGCGGRLRDSIVNFGDALGAGNLKRAADAFAEAHVGFAFGSSLLVSPANELPLLPERLVVANLQETGLDSHADVRVFCPSDEFMEMLVEELGALDGGCSAASGCDGGKKRKSEPAGATKERKKLRSKAAKALEEDVAFSRETEEERRRDALTVCVACKGRESEKGDMLVLCDGDDSCAGARHQRCMQDSKWHRATARQMRDWSWVCPTHGA